jgi:hypothetical protein
MRVDLHDVPQQGTTTHFDQGLRFELGLLAETGAQAAAQDDYLQVRAGEPGRTATV